MNIDRLIEKGTAAAEGEAIRQSNSHGCKPGKICKCPKTYRRCSLFTDWPELFKDLT